MADALDKIPVIHEPPPSHEVFTGRIDTATQVHIDRNQEEEKADLERTNGISHIDSVEVPEPETELPQPSFVIDVAPQSQHIEIPIVDRIEVDTPLGDDVPDDGDLIVYDAPQPRSGYVTPTAHSTRPTSRASHVAEASSQLSVSEFPCAPSASDLPPPPITMSPELPEIQPNPLDKVDISFNSLSESTSRLRAARFAVSSPGTKVFTKKHRIMARKQFSRSSFRAYGAMKAEKDLEDEAGLRHDARRSEQRRGDSDVDWGTSEGEAHGEDSAIEEISSGLGGMDLDPDLEMNEISAKGFLKSMSRSGMDHVIAGDLADAARIRAEDEESEYVSDDDDEDEEDEEAAMIAAAENGGFNGEESDDSEDDSEDDDSSDEDVTPKRGFQARLDRIRKQSRNSAKGKQKDGQDLSDDFDSTFRWDDDGDLLEQLEVSPLSLCTRKEQLSDSHARNLSMKTMLYLKSAFVVTNCSVPFKTEILRTIFQKAQRVSAPLFPTLG